MRRIMVILTLVALSSAGNAMVTRMDVATFLAKANSLRSKGPFALLSSDLGLLKDAGVTAGKALREERLAQVAAGKPPAYCAPAGTKMDQDQFMAAMSAVPVAERPRTSVQAAMKSYFMRKYPCPATQR